MNKDRRKRLAKAGPVIADALAKLAEARAIIEEIRDEERDVYDNLSDGARDGDLGSEMQSCIDELDTAIDAFDAIDLRGALRSIEEVANATVAGIEEHDPKITPEEAARRRQERLPQWAKDRVARLEADLRKAEDQARNMFGERTEDPTEIAISDWGSPLHGRILPAKQISFPEYGITVCIERGRGGRGVSIMGDRSLAILPMASNTFIVKNMD